MEKQDWSYLICSYLSGAISLLISAVAGATCAWAVAGPRPRQQLAVVGFLLPVWLLAGVILGINCRARIFRILSLVLAALTIVLAVVVFAVLVPRLGG